MAVAAEPAFDVLEEPAAEPPEDEAEVVAAVDPDAVEELPAAVEEVDPLAALELEEPSPRTPPEAPPLGWPTFAFLAAAAKSD
jgi:hypothetical protein